MFGRLCRGIHHRRSACRMLSCLWHLPSPAPLVLSVPVFDRRTALPVNPRKLLAWHVTLVHGRVTLENYSAVLVNAQVSDRLFVLTRMPPRARQLSQGSPQSAVSRRAGKHVEVEVGVSLTGVVTFRLRNGLLGSIDALCLTAQMLELGYWNDSATCGDVTSAIASSSQLPRTQLFTCTSVMSGLLPRRLIADQAKYDCMYLKASLLISCRADGSSHNAIHRA